MGVMATVPTNIALMKYWGKLGGQKPSTPSLSLTLNRLRTESYACFSHGSRDIIRFYEDGKWMELPLEDRAYGHLSWLRREVCGGEVGVKRLSILPLEIWTRNTFPTACGIASSASGFGALTLAVLGLWLGLPRETWASQGWDEGRVAVAASQGSGSAGRSLWPGWVLWDEGGVIPLARGDFWPMEDVVILFGGRKKVSSSRGHRAAWTSPLYGERLKRSHGKYLEIKKILERRDFEALAIFSEEESLNMHRVMLTSTPVCDYLPSDLWLALPEVRKARESGVIKAFFTMDAGSALHLICPRGYGEKTLAWARSCFSGASFFMDDMSLKGPTLWQAGL